MDKSITYSIHWRQRTKIVCTLGPGVNTPAMIERLIREGMNVARINLSHGNLDEHARYIAMVRDSAERLDNSVAILADLPGPKYRTGEMQNVSAILIRNSEVVLTNRSVLGDAITIPINFPTLAQDVKVGNRILVDDG